MPGFPSPFGADDEDLFDGYDEFVAGPVTGPARRRGTAGPR
jgi:hypothetical protein